MLEGERMCKRQDDPLVSYLFDFAVECTQLGAKRFQFAHQPAFLSSVIKTNSAAQPEAGELQARAAPGRRKGAFSERRKSLQKFVQIERPALRHIGEEPGCERAKAR